MGKGFTKDAARAKITELAVESLRRIQFGAQSRVVQAMPWAHDLGPGEKKKLQEAAGWLADKLSKKRGKSEDAACGPPGAVKGPDNIPEVGEGANQSGAAPPTGGHEHEDGKGEERHSEGPVARDAAVPAHD